MFICSGDLFVDDDVDDAFCAVLLFGLDIFTFFSSSSSYCFASSTLWLLVSFCLDFNCVLLFDYFDCLLVT